MTLHIFRVLVRGRFDHLGADQRADLVASAAEATVAAERKAIDYLATRGIGFRDLSAAATDMADVWCD